LWPGKGEEDKGKGLDKLGNIALFKFFFQSFTKQIGGK
jgi:hypothetical protein